MTSEAYSFLHGRQLSCATLVTIIATLRWASCGPGTGPGPQDAQRRVAIIVTSATPAYIIHVSAVFEVGVIQSKLLAIACAAWQFKFKLKLPPGLAAVTPVVFLCFYFASRLSHRSRAACGIPCKHSLSYINHYSSDFTSWFSLLVRKVSQRFVHHKQSEFSIY